MIDEIDVGIIGSGIFGVSTAFHIARDTNLNVALFEKHDENTWLDAGSSGRSASIVRHNYSTDLMIKSAVESHNIFKNFETEVGEPIDFINNSYLGIVADKKLDALKNIIKRVQSFGINAVFLSPEELKEKHPWLNVDEVTGAIHNLDASYVYDPQEPLNIYSKQAKKFGAKFYYNTKVTGIKTSNNSVKSILTDKGEIKVNYIINCTGPWASEIGKMINVDIPVIAQRQQLVDVLPDKKWGLSNPTFSDHEQQVYVRPMRGGIAHCGGHYFGSECNPDEYNQGVDDGFISDVMKKISLRIPSLKGAKIVKGFSGLYENTSDTYPIVGEMEELSGFINCVGWSGHGYKHGPMFGILLKELIETGKTSLDIDFLGLKRFETGKLIKTAYGVNAPYG